MNKAVKEKAKYVVRAKAGTDNSEGHSAIVAWLLRLIHRLKTEYWLRRVNRMSEGQILNTYYELTRKEREYDIGLSERAERYIDG